MSIIATYLFISAFVIPVVAVVTFNHLRINHLRVMTKTREKLTSNNLQVGTIQPNFGFVAKDVIEIQEVNKKQILK